MIAGLAVLRRADWLDARRARGYGRMLLAFCAVLVAGGAAEILAPALRHPGARPLAVDFDAFWAGAVLALRGQAALAYDPAAIRAAEAAGGQFAPGAWFIYLYPPVFQLFSLPLGMVSYLLAFATFLLASFAAFALAVRRILPASWPSLAIAALPAGAMNAIVGQNGFVSGACLAGGLLVLDSRPLLAGAILGLLAAKPHLAVCVPVGLLAARRWPALAACAGSAGASMLLSWAVLGTASWRGFLAMAPAMRATLENPAIWPKLASPYAAIRLLGGGTGAAYAAQAATAGIAIACTIQVCRQRPGAGPEMAFITAASVLCTPYIWNYDLVVLSVPLAWMAGQAGTGCWLHWEKAGLAAIYLLSGFVRLLNQEAGLPLAPVLLVLLLGLVIRRARALA